MKTLLTTLLILAGTTFFFAQNVSESVAKGKIESIRKKIVNGSSTFATSARLYSEDIDSAKKGGLWEFEKTSGDKELDKAIARLKPDEISEPIKTRNAFHLIQLVENTPGKTKVLHLLVTFSDDED